MSSLAVLASRPSRFAGREASAQEQQLRTFQLNHGRVNVDDRQLADPGVALSDLARTAHAAC
jgi:hypothetical protein